MAVKQRLGMAAQDAALRARNFKEVALGYTPGEAMAEAERCLNCKKAFCKEGCPVAVPIPEFIAALKQNDVKAAYRLIHSVNSLPAICGRVCPQEEQCERVCILQKTGQPIAIGNLERYVADWALANPGELPAPAPRPGGHKVAVVGSGPAGLTCAGDLNRLGYAVTVFEALHENGGVLIYGIPEFRLPKAIVAQEIDALKKAGVRFETNVLVGRTITIPELMKEEGFKAVFVGSGAGLPRFMGIPGENYIGVYSANEFLTRINLMKAYDPMSTTPIKRGQQVVVVGGGNVAMDAARCALRMGAAEVRIIYRRGMDELPARREEIHHAQEEGIKFELLANPTAILGEEGRVRGIRAVKMALGEPDESGRRSPRPVEGSEYESPADVVIIAIGTSPNPLIKQTLPGLGTQRWGGIIIDEETGATSLEGVYAGGDAVTGAATVILAMGAGKKAALGIHEYIQEKYGCS